ncbi:hypothetical protein PHLCEN_2v1758 [Hermanssonia centrifuga]|uniref:Uncharacterized protein n=1 Tax=Hermanssonia centrifuga TaxID=98765 RepID=A0A2R6RVY3_9APHY|nr:hypothetical protein PHLCEN_2v1758 [Hermanssonia centrifuga]
MFSHWSRSETLKPRCDREICFIVDFPVSVVEATSQHSRPLVVDAAKPQTSGSNLPEWGLKFMQIISSSTDFKLCRYDEACLHTGKISKEALLASTGEISA